MGRHDFHAHEYGRAGRSGDAHAALESMPCRMPAPNFVMRELMRFSLAVAQPRAYFSFMPRFSMMRSIISAYHERNIYDISAMSARRRLAIFFSRDAPPRSQPQKATPLDDILCFSFLSPGNSESVIGRRFDVASTRKVLSRSGRSATAAMSRAKASRRRRPLSPISSLISRYLHDISLRRCHGERHAVTGREQFRLSRRDDALMPARRRISCGSPPSVLLPACHTMAVHAKRGTTAALLPHTSCHYRHHGPRPPRHDAQLKTR